MTPYSRKEYELAREQCEDPIERARRTIVKSYFGIGDSIFNKTGFRYSKVSNTCVATSWQNYTRYFDAIIERFRGVTLECLDWKECISKYDSDEALFYFDPPYLKETRSHKHSYRHDFNNEESRSFLDFLINKKILGKVIVSGYDHEFFNHLMWKKVSKEFPTQSGKRRETLWVSDNTSCAQTEMKLIFRKV